MPRDRGGDDSTSSTKTSATSGWTCPSCGEELRVALERTGEQVNRVLARAKDLKGARAVKPT